MLLPRGLLCCFQLVPGGPCNCRGYVSQRVALAVQVDQLLAPQFREDVVRLEQHVGRKAEPGRQTILVSATLSDKVL